MKQFLLTLILLLGLSSYSSVEAQTVTQQDWKIENEGQWGSFYWSVVRTNSRDANGKYWYYVYAASNSLFNSKSNGYDYDKAITYVRNVNIYMYEYKMYKDGSKTHFNTVNVNLSHFTCDYKVDLNYYIAYFWSYREYNKFKLTFDKVTPYDNSYY